MMTNARSLPSTLLAVGLLALVAGCWDPVHADAVAALGDEAEGVEEGPTHRPGQPCLLCHGGEGPGPDFAMAGTVYETRGLPTPANGVTVQLTDAKGATTSRTTNSVGNFYVERRDWTPTYPVRVQLARGGAGPKMMTRIGRQTSCGECHKGSGSANVAPAVYFSEGTK